MSPKVEPIDLQPLLDEYDHFPTQVRIYDILAVLLQPNSHTTPTTAAEQIDNMLSTGNSQDGNVRVTDDPDGPDGPVNAEGFVWFFWSLLVRIIELIPHDHEGQEKLVELLQSLSELPPTTEKFWGLRYRLWTDLPLLGPYMREEWLSPTYYNTIPDAISASKWLNLNSFAARLLNVKLGGWPNFGVWELYLALERPRPLLAKEILACEVAVAAEWILQAGEELFNHMIEDELNEDKEDLRKNKEEMGEQREELGENKGEISEYKEEPSESKEEIGEPKEELDKEEISEGKEELSENKEEVGEQEELGENKKELDEHEEKLKKDKARSLSTGVLGSWEQGCVYRDRWAYWKWRFGEIAEEAEGSVLEWSTRAAVRMGEIDGEGFVGL